MHTVLQTCRNSMAHVTLVPALSLAGSLSEHRALDSITASTHDSEDTLDELLQGRSEMFTPTPLGRL